MDQTVNHIQSDDHINLIMYTKLLQEFFLTGPIRQFENIDWVITLSMITLSRFHSTLFLELFLSHPLQDTTFFKQTKSFFLQSLFSQVSKKRLLY